MAQLDYEDMKILDDQKSPCDDCKLFEQHGKKCHFFWENKSDCSQYSKY